MSLLGRLDRLHPMACMLDANGDLVGCVSGAVTAATTENMIAQAQVS